MKFTLTLDDFRYLKDFKFSNLTKKPEIKLEAMKKKITFKIDDVDRLKFEKSFMEILAYETYSNGKFTPEGLRLYRIWNDILSEDRLNSKNKEIERLLKEINSLKEENEMLKKTLLMNKNKEMI